MLNAFSLFLAGGLGAVVLLVWMVLFLRWAAGKEAVNWQPQPTARWGLFDVLLVVGILVLNTALG